MRVQFTSDIHLEFHNNVPRKDDYFLRFVTPCGADILVLAGDIGYPEMPITRQFLSWACANWNHVIWVLGNHEYYNKDPSYKWNKPYKKTMCITEKQSLAQDYMLELKNLCVLINNSIEFPEFPGYVFLGTTLWTTLKPEQYTSLQHELADFTYIQHDTRESFNPTHWSMLHKEDYDFLQHGLDSATLEGKKAVVITHYLPTYRMILPQYHDSPINHGFAAKCDVLLEHPATAGWICGHSHGQLDLPVNKTDGTRVFCRLNAHGYPKELSAITYSNMKVWTFP